MGYATITGQLKDSDGTAWSNATWTAVPVSPSSKPVFPDGSPVPTTGGLVDATGHFSGQIPTTIDIRPPGTTLTVTITSMTSAPPLTLTKVQIIPTTTVDLGALLSPRLVAPRIKASAIVYAYNAGEVTNPVHGNGYVNTVENQSYLFMQNSWVPIGVAGPLPANVVQLMPHINAGDVTFGGDVSGYAFVATSAGLALPQTTMLDQLNDAGRLMYRGLSGAAMPSINVAGMSGDGNGYGVYASFGPTGLGVAGIAVAHSLIANGPADVPDESASGVSAIISGIASDRSSPQFDMYFHGAGPDSGWWREVCWANQKRFCSVTDAGVETPYLVVSRVGGNVTGLTIGPTLTCNNGATIVGPTVLSVGSAGIHTTGGCIADGGFFTTSGPKAFRITHPLDDTKTLTHACLEGPENGVYYRGEAELVDGRAIVELPDYFEALTQADGRTVLLTQVDDGGELALLAASRVVDGKFSIRSNASAAIVSWEVKAERRDISRLEVEQAKRGERSESES